MKIGIIRCGEHSADCAGWHCFPALANKTGEFTRYDTVELVGFDTCGGCGRGKADKIVKQAERLKEKGAEAIHLGNCLVGGCPSKDMFIKELKQRVTIPIVENTHGGPSPAQIAAHRAAQEAKRAQSQAQ